MTIKQSIPKGWIEAQLPASQIKHTSIPHKIIVTDWLWRNKHAEAIETVIIPNQKDFVYRDKVISEYIKRIKITN